MVVTRVGQPEPGKAGTDKDFYADLDKAKRKPGCFSCGGCLGLLFVLLLLLLLGVFSVVAASGVADIPVLSPIFYKADPAPTRVIEAATATDIGKLIESKQTAAVGGALDQSSVQGGAIELTEDELTAALREPTQSGKVALKRGQIAIDADHAEIYGQVTPGEYGRPVVLRAELSPAGGNQLELTRVRIGYVDVPIKVARYIGGLFVGQDIGSTAALSRFGVTGLTISAGSVLVTVDPTSLLEKAGQSVSAETERILKEAGIDPETIGNNLSQEKLRELAEKISTLTADQAQALESAIPQLKRLDQ